MMEQPPAGYSRWVPFTRSIVNQGFCAAYGRRTFWFWQTASRLRVAILSKITDVRQRYCAELLQSDLQHALGVWTHIWRFTPEEKLSGYPDSESQPRRSVFSRSRISEPKKNVRLGGVDRDRHSVR